MLANGLEVKFSIVSDVDFVVKLKLRLLDYKEPSTVDSSPLTNLYDEFLRVKNFNFWRALGDLSFYSFLKNFCA